MADAEERRRLNELVEGIVVVVLPAVEDVRQAEEEGGYHQIPPWDDEPQPVQIHQYSVKTTHFHTPGKSSDQKTKGHPLFVYA